MDIQIEDIVQLQRETGAAENDQRLRAIVAERQVRELRARIVEIEKQVESPAPKLQQEVSEGTEA